MSGEPKKATAPDLDEAEAKSINAYADEVRKTFDGDFTAAGDRFKDGQKLLQRFDDAICALFASGRSFISGVDEAHNELCVANQLLVNTSPQFTLEYEPVLTGCAKTIDFRAAGDNGDTVFVDVKTIKPKPKDRWDQFQKALKEGWFPDNVRVTLSEEWLGGELWHYMFAARSKMLEYSLELEAKIADCKLPDGKRFFILALCGEGFHWHQDGLEDFVSFYRKGSHRGDDPFSQVEAHHIDTEKISLTRSIGRFACLIRPQFEIRHTRLNWNVQPPKAPVF